MSIKAMNYVWERSKSQGTARLVLLALADSCGDDGEWSPGVSSLAQKVNLSERQTQRCLRELENIGEIRILQNQGIRTGSGNTNRYQMVIYRQIHGLEAVTSMTPLDSVSGDIYDTPQSQAVTSMTPQAVTSMSPKPSVYPPVKSKEVSNVHSIQQLGIVAGGPIPNELDEQRQLSAVTKKHHAEVSEQCNIRLHVDEHVQHVASQRTSAAPQSATKSILDAFIKAKREHEPGAVINYGKEGKAAKAIAAQGWTPEQVVECGRILYNESFYQDKPLSLMTIASQIGAKLKRTPPPGAAAPRPYETLDMEAIFGKSYH